MSDGVFVDTTGLFSLEVHADHPDGPYPAMVVIDNCSFGSLLPDDARRLAAQIVEEADLADERNQEP